ncbi:MAG: hypothetical protein C4305_06920 [Thermoleophilia bacterium]
MVRLAQRETSPADPRQRTVGQLVADTVRFYGNRFWPSLALGLGPAALTVAGAQAPRGAQVAIVGIGFPLLMTLSFIQASFLVSGLPFQPASARVALAVGLLVSLPVPFLAALLVLPAVLWLAAIGLAVPAAVIEGAGVRDSLRRGFQLGRADYVHAAGALALLVVLVALTQLLLFQLLTGLSDQALIVAAFLANLVVSPLLFLGGVHLYYDQAARERRPQRGQVLH